MRLQPLKSFDSHIVLVPTLSALSPNGHSPLPPLACHTLEKTLDPPTRVPPLHSVSSPINARIPNAPLMTVGSVVEE